MALLVLICTRFTLAEITNKEQNGKSQHHCQVVLIAKFTESAPHDSVEFRNMSSDGWHVQSVLLTLDSSGGNLIFDTEEGGNGVEVYQQNHEESDSARPASIAKAADGDQSLQINFSDFPSGANYIFSINLDDQLAQSELGNVRVAGGEINGAALVAEIVSPDGTVENVDSTFGKDSRAIVKADCW